MLKNNYLFLAICWTLIITYLSLFDTGSLGSKIAIPYKDKMVHFVFYFLFYILWHQALITKKGNSYKLYLIIITIAYGIIMELFQHFMSFHRSADVFDVLANSTGVFTAYLFIYNTNYFKK